MKYVHAVSEKPMLFCIMLYNQIFFKFIKSWSRYFCVSWLAEQQDAMQDI